MSQEVDNRVVQMRFDNAQFEKGVKQTRQSLEGLKESLKLEDAAKGVEQVALKFSALEVAATTAIANIANKLTNYGLNLAKSLSIDQVTAGFGKYESELKAVKTIMNATGESIETVNSELEKLMWYTDETSYEYSNMVDNISKFTSQGIKLKDANREMQGIANMAGYVGASVSDAAHAMDGFSKAMASGYMNRQNWSWIQTAHMETMQTKQAFIDAAKALGRLTDAGDGLLRTQEGNVVTATQFRETLKDGWLDAKVMEKTFSDMASYSDIIYNFKEAYNNGRSELVDTSTAMEILDDTTNRLNLSEEDLTKKTQAYIYAVKKAQNRVLSLDEAEKELATIMDTVARKGFEAGQQYRTFTDAVEATKDAVSSGWKSIFASVFGDANEATKLWTEVGGAMYDAFMGDLQPVVDMLKNWHDMGGFEYTLRSVKALLEGISNVITPIRDAFKAVFPIVEARKFLEITRGVAVFLEGMQLSEEAVNGLRIALEAVLKPLKLVVNILKVAAVIVSVFAIGIATLIDNFLTLISETDSLSGALKASFGEAGYNLIAGFINGIKSGTDKVIKAVSTVGTLILTTIKNILGIHSPSEEFKKIAKACVDGFIAGITYTFGKIYKLATYMTNCISNLFAKIDLGRIIITAFTATFTAGVSAILFSSAKLIAGFGSLLSGVGSFVKNLGKSLKNISSYFKNIGRAQKYEALASTFKGLAIAVGALVASLIALSFIPVEKLKVGANALTQLLAVMGMFITVLSLLKNLRTEGAEKVTTIADVLDNAVNKFSKPLLIASFGVLATSLGIGALALAASIKILASIPGPQLLQAAIVLAAFDGLLIALGALLKTGDKMGIDKNVIKFGAMVYKLSASLLIFVSAIKALSLLSGSEFDEPKKAVMEFISFFSAFAIMLSVIGSEGKEIDNFGDMMLKMAVALTLFLVPIALINKMVNAGVDITAGQKFIIQCGIFFAAFAVLCKFAGESFSKNLNKLGVAMISLALAIDLMLIPIMLLSGMDASQIANGTAFLEAVVKFMAVFITLGTIASLLDASLGKMAGAMVALASAVLLMSIPFILLSLISPAQVNQSITLIKTIGLFFAAFIGMAVIAAKSKADLLKAAGAIAIVTVCLIAISGMIYILSALPITGMLAAAGSLSLTVLAIAGALVLVSKLAPTAVLAGAAIAIVSGSLLLIAGALYLLKGIDLKSALIAVGSLVVVLAAITGAMYLLAAVAPVAILAAAAIAIINVSLLALAAGIKILSSIDSAGTENIANLFKMFISMAPGLSMFAASIFELSGSFMALALSFAGIAISGLAVAGVIALFSISVTSLATALSLAGPAIASFGDGVAHAIAVVDEAFRNSVVGAGLYAAGGLIEGAIGGIKSVWNSGVELAKSFLGGLTSPEGLDEHSNSKKTIAAGEYLDGGLIEGITNGLGDVGDAGTLLGSTTVDAFKEGLTPTKDMGTEIVGNITTAFKSGAPQLTSAASDLGSGVTTALTDSADIGGFITNLLDGGKEGLGKLKDLFVGSEGEVLSIGEIFGTLFGNGMISTGIPLIDNFLNQVLTKTRKAYSGVKSIEVAHKRYTRFKKDTEEVDDANIDLAGSIGSVGTASTSTAKSIQELSREYKFGTSVINKFSKAYDNVLSGSTEEKLKMSTIAVENLALKLYQLSDQYQEDLNNADLSSEDVLSSIKGSFEETYNAISNSIKNIDILSKWEDGIDDNTKSVNELALAYHYGEKAVSSFVTKYGASISKLDSSANITDIAEKSIDTLAMRLYQLSDEYEEDMYNAELETEDVVSHIQKSFNDMLNGLESSISSIDIWSKFTKQSKISAKVMLENAEKWTKSIEEYQTNLNTVLGSNISDSLKKYLAGLGYSGANYISAFANATEEELAKLSNMWTSYEDSQSDIPNTALATWSASLTGLDDLITNGVSTITSDFNKTFKNGLNTEAGMSEAEQMAQNTIDAIRDTLVRGVSDIKSAVKTALNADKDEITLDNILGNITQWNTNIEEYKDNLTAFEGMDFSDEFKSYITKLGFEGREYLAQLVNADDDMIEEINSAYAEFLDSTTNVADEALASWAGCLSGVADLATPGAQLTGENFCLGFKNGLDVNAGVDNATMMAINTLNAMNEALGIHSPSEKARQIALMFCAGLNLGFTQNMMLIYNQARGLAQNIITGVKGVLYTQADEVRAAAYHVGLQLDAGLASGIEDGSGSVYSAVRRVVRRAIEAAEDEADINSPSKEFAWMGKMMDEGLAEGISDNADKPANAIATSFSSIINSLYDYLDTNLDSSFVITPILDLSEIQNGVSQINEMFASPTVGTNGQNEKAGIGGNNYQFIQNNYSPKSLSRIDIYRQTKSQFSMLKGVNQ